MTDHRVKLKESEKRDKYLKKYEGVSDTNCNWCTWNNLQSIDKETKRGRNQMTIQITALLRLARILRRVLETWGDLLSLKFQCETIS